LEAVADCGYFNGDEIKACVDAGITVTLPKPMTSSAKAEARLARRISCIWPRKKLSLSGRRETYIPFYKPRTRAEAAPLLDQCLPELRCAFSKHCPVVHCNLVLHGRLAEASAGGAEERGSWFLSGLFMADVQYNQLAWRVCAIAMVVQSL
jgi:hypothetical protein